MNEFNEYPKWITIPITGEKIIVANKQEEDSLLYSASDTESDKESDNSAIFEFTIDKPASETQLPNGHESKKPLDDKQRLIEKAELMGLPIDRRWGVARIESEIKLFDVRNQSKI